MTNAQGNGLEFQFLSEWSGWDEVDTFSLQFNDAVLLPEVAALVGRDTVDCMTVWGDECKVTFWCADGFEKEFKFKAELLPESE